MNSTDHWLINKYIAHRGFHNEEYPENTLGAFQRAIENGYAIELDVQLLQDGTVVVIHDTKLSNLLGVDKYTSTCTLEEIKKYNVLSSNEKVPTLIEVLEFVDGRAPILIEIKNTLKAGDLEKATWEILKDYTGEFAIQSFNPYSLAWFKEHAPNVLRGQLSSYFKGVNLNFIKKILLKKLKVLKISEPHFISYDGRCLPNKYVKKCELPVLAWTIQSQEDYMRVVKYVDNIIFENFTPTI